MNNKKTSRSKHIDFIVLDLICVEVSFLLAYMIRLGNASQKFSDGYALINGLIIIAHAAIVFYTEGYSGILRRGYWREIKSVITYNIELLAVVLAILFFSKQSADYSRIVMGLFFVINTILMYIVRTLRKNHLCKINIKTGKLNRMLLLTDYEHADGFIKGLQTYNYSSFYVEGIVILDKDMQGDRISDIPVVANAVNMYDYVKAHVIDEVFIGSGDEGLGKITDKFLSMGVMVHISVNRIIPRVPNPTLENINDYTVVTTSISFMSFKQKVIKRLIDIIVSIPGIIATGILFIILGPIIYHQSPGPIFFKQERVGKNGRTFKIYKFRSMYMDAEERKKDLMKQNKMQGLMFKMDDDPRITPIGKFIRKTSLDEFPQFINIFKGDMSLVGTRPPTVDEYMQYDAHHKSRLAIKPGLTGLWQVSGRSDITDFEEVVRLDNEYIKNFSIAYDFKIILKTVGVVFKHKGSV
ncbi:MAG: sugar transferase [Lachnospiraceae bacterium]|nr:sugar transferase [Lachnospiraceae bacterium]